MTNGKAIAIVTLLGATGALIAASPAAAQGATRSAEAHVHGHGTLNIAVEGQQLHMELEVPGADVFGFEHEAESEAEKEIAKMVLADLKRPLSLFVLPAAAGCQLVSADVGIHEEHEHEHKSDKHAEHDHDKDEEKQAKDEGHGHGEEQEAGHNEVHAEYALRCDKPGAIDSIRFVYFERFAGAEELDVNLITANGQRSFEVSRDQPVLGLQGMM